MCFYFPRKRSIQIAVVQNYRAKHPIYNDKKEELSKAIYFQTVTIYKHVNSLTKHSDKPVTKTNFMVFEGLRTD